MKNTNIGWGEYFKPTPKNVRKIADSILVITGTIGALMPGAEWVPAAGVIAKVVSNFLSPK